MRVIFIGTNEQEYHGEGKQNRFLGIATKILEEFGIEVFKAIGKDELYNIPRAGQNVAVLIYNEEASDKVFAEIHEKETICSSIFENLTIIHPSKTARIIANKRASCDCFEANGIPTPRQVFSPVTDTLAFSNSLIGSGREVQLLEKGSALDPKRFNTEFIDTRQMYKGQEYFVSLRAMAFWRYCTAIYVRCRPVGGESWSVHAADTPHDPELLNYIHAKTVMPHQKEILEICERIGDCLGYGFYSHDILPSSNGRGLYVCETGLKFDEQSLNVRLHGLEGQVVMPELFNQLESIKMAYAFALELRSCHRVQPPIRPAG